MFEKHYEIDGSNANTLAAEEVCENHGSQAGFSTRTHKDGWAIAGIISEDYCYWVNDFEANHPVFGRVWGNFESVVFADSEDGFNDFLKKHPPEYWDYYDI